MRQKMHNAPACTTIDSDPQPCKSTAAQDLEHYRVPYMAYIAQSRMQELYMCKLKSEHFCEMFWFLLMSDYTESLRLLLLAFARQNQFVDIALSIRRQAINIYPKTIVKYLLSLFIHVCSFISMIKHRQELCLRLFFHCCCLVAIVFTFSEWKIYQSY